MTHNYPDDSTIDVTDSRSPDHEEPTYTCIICYAHNEFTDMTTVDTCKKCNLLQDKEL